MENIGGVRTIQDLESIGNYIGYKIIQPVSFAGKKVRALGNQLYISENPHETFHEFLVLVFSRKLGKTWFDSESGKEITKRHFLYNCFVEFQNQGRNINWENNIETVAFTPNGYTQFLISLAFDLFCLIQTSNLPNSKLLKRLKNYKQFQGAAYEIRIAGIFARMGFTIEFMDNTVSNNKKCEFSARKGNEMVYIEAKSKHRNGVLHETGVFSNSPDVDWKITKQISEATQQLPNGETYVFVDLNLPILDVGNREKKINDQIPKIAGYINLDKFNALFVTNFAYHYDQNNPHSVSKYLRVYNLNAKVSTLINDLDRAIGNYDTVPDLDFISRGY